MCAAIKIAGACFFCPALRKAWRLHSLLTESSSTSGRHFSAMTCLTGSSLPESPGRESNCFKNGEISFIVSFSVNILFRIFYWIGVSVEVCVAVFVNVGMGVFVEVGMGVSVEVGVEVSVGVTVWVAV